MNSFPSYDPSGKCPKCGYDDVSTTYVALGGSFWEPCFDAPTELAKSEHLHRHCNRCSYTWCEACIPFDLLDDDEWNYAQAINVIILLEKIDKSLEMLLNEFISLRKTFTEQKE